MNEKEVAHYVTALILGMALAFLAGVLTACGETSTTEPMVEDGLPSSSSMGPPADLLNADTLPAKTGVPYNIDQGE